MNIGIIVIEAIIFAIYFTIDVFGLAKSYKYTPAMIYNYPKDIQDEYFKTHERVDVSLKSKNVWMSKTAAILAFSLILVLCAYFAGAKTFLDGFIVSLVLMLWIGIYDTFFIDWVLFANLKIFRLEGTEHMDKEYHQKWFHLKGMLFPGTLFGIIISVIVGLMTMFVN